MGGDSCAPPHLNAAPQVLEEFMGSNMTNAMAPGPAAAPRNNMMPPNIFDPRTDGSDYYWYAANPGSSAAGVTSNTSIPIDAGTDFYWIATTIQADIAEAALLESTDIIPLVTVLINDTGTSRNLMNTPIPLGSLCGDGKRPYRLVRPRLFRANSIINLTFTNYSAGTTYGNLYFTMHGYRRLVTPPNASTGS
jgi:hypothetical protein